MKELLVKHNITTIMNLHEKFEAPNIEMFACMFKYKKYLVENEIMTDAEFFTLMDEIISHEKFDKGTEAGE